MTAPCAVCGGPGVHHATLDGRFVKVCIGDSWRLEGNPPVSPDLKVIRVKCLASALAARVHGGAAVELATGEPGLPSRRRHGWSLAGQFAATAVAAVHIVGDKATP